MAYTVEDNIRFADEDTVFICSCGFKSSGWNDFGLMEERAYQHVEEHNTGEPMIEIGIFSKQNAGGE
jgi:hypothetical protein